MFLYLLHFLLPSLPLPLSLKISIKTYSRVKIEKELEGFFFPVKLELMEISAISNQHEN